MGFGITRASNDIMATASTTPAVHPRPASSKPSVTNCRTKRAGVAPRAPRTAVSRLRLSARTSIRLATFTQAISSSRPAPSTITSRDSACGGGRLHPVALARLAAVGDAGIDFEVRAHVSGTVQNGLFQGACRAYPDVLGCESHLGFRRFVDRLFEIAACRGASVEDA